MLRSFGATQDKEGIKDLTNKKIDPKWTFFVYQYSINIGDWTWQNEQKGVISNIEAYL